MSNRCRCYGNHAAGSKPILNTLYLINSTENRIRSLSAENN